MFDIVKQDFSKSAENGYTFELKLPDGTPSGAKLTIIGDMSKTVKAYGRRKFSEFQQRAATAKRKGKDIDQIDLDEAEDSAIESALVRLIGWQGITENGKVVEFSKEKAAEILRAHPWIREAIIEEASDVTNFRPE
jgi:hypothetical protein